MNATIEEWSVSEAKRIVRTAQCLPEAFLALPEHFHKITLMEPRHHQND